MPLERIEENFEGPSWSNRIFFYFCLFSFLIIIFLLVFIGFAAINPDFAIPNGPNYNTTELRNIGFFDNERYLISALVQSLAATIALVITLSLVAVQLAAQSYSTRVIDVYKKSPDMWILLCIYIAVIFYGLGLLKVIDVGAGINMELAIFAAYFLGFFAFVCLVPYILKTLDLLKPSTVINLLAEKITKENVLAALKTSEVVAEIDPVQPIIDIINSALERNDYETVRNGLTAIRKSTIAIIESIDNKKSEDDELVHYIVQHVERFGTMAINRKNEDSAKSAIFNLGSIGIKTIEKRQDFIASNITIIIGNLGLDSMKRELGGAVFEVIEALEKIGEKAAIDEKLKWTLKNSTDRIKVIMEEAKESNWEDVVGEAQIALYLINKKINII